MRSPIGMGAFAATALIVPGCWESCAHCVPDPPRTYGLTAAQIAHITDGGAGLTTNDCEALCYELLLYGRLPDAIDGGVFEGFPDGSTLPTAGDRCSLSGSELTCTDPRLYCAD